VKRSMVNLTKHEITELTALLKTRVRRMLRFLTRNPGLLRGVVGVAGQGFSESSAPLGAGPRRRLTAGGTRHFAGAEP
jgi:hypothetical protein